jgi:hypothetical protein
MVDFLVDITAGSRRVRIRGFIALVAGIALTVAANFWALLRT